MDRPVGLSIFLVLALFVWLIRRTPSGRVRLLVNRLSVIGGLVSAGMLLGCVAIEATGHMLPFESWLSGISSEPS